MNCDHDVRHEVDGLVRDKNHMGKVGYVFALLFGVTLSTAFYFVTPVIQQILRA
jgi:hypothetical protein